MVIHAQWPDGETRREELNLLALRGRRYEHQIWKRRERSPVDVRAVPGRARLILVATDGSETVEARDRVEGWLARRPYAVRARWQDGASADTLLTPGAGDTAAVQSLTVCPEPKANALPTAATPDSAEAGEMNPGKPPSGLSPR
jgi:hypothetical protein